MGTTALIFYDNIVNTVTVLLTIFALVIEGIAFVHCVTQRSDAFPAIGTIPKGAWLAILGVCLLLTLTGFGGGVISIFGLIGIAAALIYLLDVRAGLRDMTDGKGSW
jgi:Protein of unknown function (DUF2516)